MATILLALSPLLFGENAYNIEKQYHGLFDNPIGFSYVLAIIYLIPMSIQMGPLFIYSGMKSPHLNFRHTTIFNLSLIIFSSIFFIAELITKRPILLF